MTQYLCFWHNIDAFDEKENVIVISFVINDHHWTPMSSHHRHQCCNQHYRHYHVVYNRYNDYYQQYLVQLLPHKFLFLPTIITDDGNEHNIRIQIHLKSKYKYKYKISKYSHILFLSSYQNALQILIFVQFEYKYI